MYRQICSFVLVAATLLNRRHVAAVTAFSCSGRNIGFYTNPDECESYYICTGGSDVTPIACASGLQFNSQTKFCDYPKNVNCNGRHSAIAQPPQTQRPVVTLAPFTTQSPINLNTNGPITNVPLQTGRPLYTNPPQPTFLPPALTQNPLQTGRPPYTNPPQPTFLPPTNSPLQTFAPLQTAGPATYAPLQTARPGSNFGRTTSPPVTNAPVQTSRPGGIFLPHFTNRPQATNAPHPTQGPQSFRPVLPTSNICFGKIDGYFTDPKDCGYYYQCSYGQAIREPCPPRLVFNEKTNACDYTQNVPACSQYLVQGGK
ncbi:chondroitin proteoglycan 1-like [Argopecten irradians]|uniref:chondroitin proteoglycan 1-like n=1 Tax=Argopecten irradians TaxID=31199 RepID=UPI003715E7D8